MTPRSFCVSSKPLLCLLFISILSNTTFAQNKPAIIPVPASYVAVAGTFPVTGGTGIIADNAGALNASAFFRDYLRHYYSLDLKANPKKVGSDIVLQLSPAGFQSDEAYLLRIRPTQITISAKGAAGLFYGFQTLIQLLPASSGSGPVSIPCADITDAPRFGYRGMHLDVCRHFMPVDFVKKYIDYLALHKMNRFHWHLTDDQGWRIGIKKYPRLTSVGGCRNGTIIGHHPGTGNDGKRHCGFYTQEQIRDIVKYAAARYITIIPEIEMPGHAMAALAAYPQLGCPGTGPFEVQQTWGVFNPVFCAGQDSTFVFLQNVLDEVMQLFPSKIIHVGGDECPKDAWKACPLCQARIRKEGLKDEHGLQSYFVQRMEKFLNSHGRTLMGWNEILEGGLAPNAMVMSWQGERGGVDAAKQGHYVVMTPGSHCYFDHSQATDDDSLTIGGYTPVEKVYGYEPVPAALSEKEAGYIMGAQGNVWTEYMETPQKVEYMVFPRMAALSEVLWSPAAMRSWGSFEQRLATQKERYALWGAHFYQDAP